MPKLPMPDVVVILPGIGGSALQRNGKDAWNFTAGTAWNAIKSLGGSITGLELADDDPEKDVLDDGVTAPHVLPDLHIIPGLWRIDGYGVVAKDLQRRFDLTDGDNFFAFAYDWRRTNMAAAHKLQRLSTEWLRSWRQKSGNADAKLILVGHSMGGIVARLFLEHLDGWKDTKALITFGTPYQGSVNAIDFLANGLVKKVLGIKVADLSGLVRSFTSVFELLPSNERVVDVGGPTWVGLDDAVGQLPWMKDHADRVLAGINLNRQVNAAAQARHDSGTNLYEKRPIVGGFQETRLGVKVAGDGIEILNIHEGADIKGDSTVPLLSAFPPELRVSAGNAAYFAAKHASLQNTDAVLVHLAGLLQAGVLAEHSFAPDEVLCALDVDDVFGEADTIEVRVKASASGVDHELLVERLDGDTATEVRRIGLGETVEDTWKDVEVDPLPAGDYRMTVTSDFGLIPVNDVFSVLDGV